MTIPIAQAFAQQDHVQLCFVFDATLDDVMSRKVDALIMPDIYPLLDGLDALTLMSYEDVLVFPDCMPDVREAIESLPLITKAFDETYIATCRRQLRATFNVNFQDSQSVATMQEQLMRVSLGQGFAIMPRELSTQMQHVIVCDLDETYREKALLVYRRDAPVQLNRLVSFVMKKSADA